MVSKVYEVIVHTDTHNYTSEPQVIKLKRLKKDLRRFIKCSDVFMISVGVLCSSSNSLLKDRIFINNEKDIQRLF